MKDNPLRKLGTLGQQLLWAGTSTKNPEYSDVKYIESLIGRDTVDTVPVETLDDYREHGDPEIRAHNSESELLL